jgi:hypothetical protein
MTFSMLNDPPLHHSTLSVLERVGEGWAVERGVSLSRWKRKKESTEGREREKVDLAIWEV